jgi:hypothetical protein
VAARKIRHAKELLQVGMAPANAEVTALMKGFAVLSSARLLIFKTLRRSAACKPRAP